MHKIKYFIPFISFIIAACGSQNLITVNFDSRGGSVVSSQNVSADSLLTPPIVDREGYTLEGWYTSINGGATLESKWDFFNDRVNFDFTLYAQWMINEYTITFETNGGNSFQSQTYDYAESLSLPTPNKAGHSFAGWYTDVGLIHAFTLNTMPASDLNLYAKWTINQYTITFETNGGSTIQPITLNYGESVTTPADPYREGYTFNGWYSDVNLTQLSAIPTVMPSSNLTFYAKWTINQYTITFETNGGSSVASITGNYGDAVSIPNDPTREGYTFSGWYANSQLTHPTTVPNAIPARNLTFYAKWTINQYTITFETNGGSTIQPITLNYGESVTTPADPYREGYTFNGWYSDVNLTQLSAIPTVMPSSNLTFYAGWL